MLPTDSTPVDEPKNPETCDVFKLYRLFANNEQVETMRQNYLAGGYGYGHAKQELFEVLDGVLAEPRERYHAWLDEPDRLEAVLEEGAVRAREAADKTLERVRSRVGLTPTT